MENSMFREHLLRLFTLDPLHIGVGQDIMGEVDLPIDREEETGVPRIPGTSLKGGFRSHAAWKLKMDGLKEKPCPGEEPAAQDGPALGMEERQLTSDVFCQYKQCPMCQAFGFPSLKLKDNNQDIKGHEGRIWFRDARLAFFPAVTDMGTFWFSTPGRASAYLGLETGATAFGWPELGLGLTHDLALAVKPGLDRLVVGWIEISGIMGEAKDGSVQAVLQALKDKEMCFPGEKYWRYIVDRTLLLDETNFYRLVETCLERRTCNRVDPETGAVHSGALFSYEALPRNSLLYSRLSVDNSSFNASDKISSLEAVCNLAREGLARMGIGGLQTRGLGSVLVEELPEPESTDPGAEK